MCKLLFHNLYIKLKKRNELSHSFWLEGCVLSILKQTQWIAVFLSSICMLNNNYDNELEYINNYAINWVPDVLHIHLSE